MGGVGLGVGCGERPRDELPEEVQDGEHPSLGTGQAYSAAYCRSSSLLFNPGLAPVTPGRYSLIGRRVSAHMFERSRTLASS